MGDSKESDNQYPKTYVVTSAQGIQNPSSAKRFGKNSNAGKVNSPLLKNIENYVENNDAELQICLVPGSYVNEIMFDESLLGREDVYIEKGAKGRLLAQIEREGERREKSEEGKSKGKDFQAHYFWDIPDENKILDLSTTGKRLNSNVGIFGIPEPSQNKNPLAGKKGFTSEFGGGRGNSMIMPATKQNLDCSSKGQSGSPKLMISSGSCTNPSYNLTNRMGFLADKEHELGFAVVDVIDSKRYLPRLVPAQKNGTFVDKGMQYSPGKKPKKIRAWAMTIGDSHVHELDPITDIANDEMILYFRPRFLHLNDAFDAGTIGIHDLEDELIRMEKAGSKRNNLEEELVDTGDYIMQKAELLGKDGVLKVNYSNHDHMLYRWIAKGAYRNDDLNRRMAHKIAGEFNKGDLAIEVALRKVLGFNFKNVEFLKPEDDAIYWEYQFAAHGHLGKNGARGSLNSLMEAYNHVVIGHVHKLEVKQGSASAGTSSVIPMHYQKGHPSTSMAGNVVLYEGGLIQALPIIDGMW